jgi:hypothetical protein
LTLEFKKQIIAKAEAVQAEIASQALIPLFHGF